MEDFKKLLKRTVLLYTIAIVLNIIAAISALSHKQWMFAGIYLWAAIMLTIFIRWKGSRNDK